MTMSSYDYGRHKTECDARADRLTRRTARRTLHKRKDILYLHRQPLQEVSS